MGFSIGEIAKAAVSPVGVFTEKAVDAAVGSSSELFQGFDDLLKPSGLFDSLLGKLLQPIAEQLSSFLQDSGLGQMLFGVLQCVTGLFGAFSGLSGVISGTPSGAIDTP